MHPVQSIGYAAAYPAYPLNPPLWLNIGHMPYIHCEVKAVSNVEKLATFHCLCLVVGISM